MRRRARAFADGFLFSDSKLKVLFNFLGRSMFCYGQFGSLVQALHCLDVCLLCVCSSFVKARSPTPVAPANATYRHKKSLNKHWRDKHTTLGAVETLSAAACNAAEHIMDYRCSSAPEEASFRAAEVKGSVSSGQPDNKENCSADDGVSSSGSSVSTNNVFDASMSLQPPLISQCDSQAETQQ